MANLKDIFIESEIYLNFVEVSVTVIYDFAIAIDASTSASFKLLIKLFYSKPRSPCRNLINLKESSDVLFEKCLLVGDVGRKLQVGMKV
jgi:hypothetical protein